MQKFDELPHEQQLTLLRQVAQNAIPFYDLPSDVGVELINISENATYRVEILLVVRSGLYEYTEKGITLKQRSLRSMHGQMPCVKMLG